MSYSIKDANGNPQTVTPPTIGPAASSASLSVTPATDAIAEPGGAPITAATMPAGGVGLTGWLSAIWKALTGTLTVGGSVSVSNFPSGAATDANLSAAQAQLHADLQGLQSTVATDSSASNIRLATGTQGDIAYTGSGNGTVISTLKGIFAKLAGTITVAISGTPTVNLGTLNGAATDSNLTTVAGAAGTSPPALAASASGLIGWLRKVVDTLTSGFATAATDAHLTNVQSAPGTAQTTALTVQGNASGIALPAALSGSDPGVAAIVSALVAGVLTPPIQMRAQSVVVTDLASTTLTATGTGSAIALDSGNTYGALINVTAVSGTTPTLDLILQESFDGGVTFTDIFMVQRIKATGTFSVPTMLLTGQRRWRWAISGTSPSFTLSIIATRGTGTAQLIRQFFDYTTLTPNATGTPSPTWNVAGVKVGYAFISVSAQTTAVTIQPYMSPDGTNFGSFGNQAVSSATVGLVAGSFSNPPLGLVRNVVATAGSGVTMNFNGFYGVG